MENKKLSFEEKSKLLLQPLNSNEISLRIFEMIKKEKTVYISLFAYKTAQTDTNRLNKIFGAGYWKNEFYLDKMNNVVCSIFLYNDEIKEWIKKSDVGTPIIDNGEYTARGSYSEAFKRAGSRLGIGIELYNLPEILIPITEKDTIKVNGIYKYKHSIKKWKFDPINKTIYENKNLIWEDETKKKKQIKLTKAEFEKAKKDPEKALILASNNNVFIKKEWKEKLMDIIREDDNN